MDSGGEGRRRSSRLSGQARKRRRSDQSSDSSDHTKSKMSKNSETTTVNFTFQDIKNFMNGEFMTTVNRTIDRNMKKLSDRIDQTQDDLRTHKEQMGRELAKMREELGAERPMPALSSYADAAAAAKPMADATPKHAAGSDRREHQYWRARRSSRFFPINGETEEELRKSLRLFCTEKLRILAEDLQDDDVEHIRRVRQRRGRESFAEVVVLFNNIETRDRITSYARNLGQFVDAKGKPTAGIRFAIPDHLTGVHRTLLQYGHALWTKNNKSGEFKRNVRFDDTGMTFCLDVKLPGKTTWLTVNHERAAKERKLSQNNDLQEEDLLSLGPVIIGEPVVTAEDAGRSVSITSWRAPTGK